MTHKVEVKRYECVGWQTAEGRAGGTETQIICLDQIRRGSFASVPDLIQDTFIVWKLDRLGRDLRHLINVIHDLSTRSIGFKVLTGHGASIDTTTPAGKRSRNSSAT
jgi:DNA invertase Pin-like site-specific DNA recombinase